MDSNKDITYLNKDFNDFKQNLINFTKQYFPNDYSDFNEGSPGMIFMEMSAYVGDVLSYYTDNNLKESMIQHASEQKNIYDLAKNLGYTVKSVRPAYTTLDVFQLIPATGSGNNVRPDYTYALNIKSGLSVRQNNGPSEFRTLDPVDFSISSSNNPTDVSIYQSNDSNNQPVYYLLKKSTRAVSGQIKTTSFTFNDPIAYDKVVLPDTNIIDIISVEESDGDNWYQVPYLAQDTIFEEIQNVAENDPTTAQYRNSVSSLLKLKKTSKRFVTRLRSDGKLELQFGSGISDNNDEEIIPNPDNVGNGLSGFRRPIDVDIDPANFLYTRTYGQAPANTTLTIKYTVGNGLQDNVDANTLSDINSISFNDNINSSALQNTLNFIKNSVSVTNPEPARGAQQKDTLQDIKNSSVANFATQNRLVTKEDYIIRSYSMPTRFGTVSKAYIIPDDQISQNQLEDQRVANPLAMNLYVLGYNNNKQLTELNAAIKENLKNYLDYYRILTDAVNIKDAFIINIGLDFEITVLQNYNSNDVLLRVIDNLKSYFDIDKWQINQTINKTEVLNNIANTKGVQSVINISFKNLYKTSDGYSGNRYDLTTATKNGIIYPSLDPSIFEVKYPNSNIRGRVVNY